MSILEYKIAAITDTGTVRDHNEDNFIIAPDLAKRDWYFDTQTTYAPKEDGAVWVVADGMGGTNAGEVASEMAIQTVKERFNAVKPDGSGYNDPKSFLDGLIRTANENILNHTKEHPETDGMGTTLIIAWLLDDHLHLSWIGDSRAYLFRSNQLQPLSKDHSLVQEMVDAGKLTEEQAFYHPNNNIITQSLGGETNQLDPGYKKVELFKGDKILLCSDGLNGMLTDERIQHIIRENQSTENTATQLVKAAISEGGHDNITLVLSEIVNGKTLDKAAAGPISQTEKAGGPLQTASYTFNRRTGTLLLMVLSFLLGALVVYFAPMVWDSISSEGDEQEKTEEKIKKKVPGGGGDTTGAESNKNSSNGTEDKQEVPINKDQQQGGQPTQEESKKQKSSIESEQPQEDAPFDRSVNERSKESKSKKSNPQEIDTPNHQKSDSNVKDTIRSGG